MTCPTCRERPTQEQLDLWRVERWIQRKLNDAPDGLTGRELNRMAPNRDRHLIGIAIESLYDDGLIRRGGPKWYNP